MGDEHYKTDDDGTRLDRGTYGWGGGWYKVGSRSFMVGDDNGEAMGNACGVG